MQNKDNKKKIHGSDLIYLLAWHDAIERLDTLILEIRHLQTSILSHLREPVLYLVLRFEERSLWGEEWIDNDKFKDAPIDELINLWMLHYPAASDLGKKNFAKHYVYQGDKERKEEDKEKIKKKVMEKLKEIWASSTWNRDQRRNYHSLWGLQQLKHQIFRDKLFLCKHAIQLKIHKSSLAIDFGIKRKSELLILRAAVLRNVEQYILLLRNFQNAFNKSMDAGIQDHLRPSIERRRELGVYMDYLSERSKDILRDMSLMLKELGAEKKYSKTRIIFHRWRHHFTSTTELLDINYPSISPEEKHISQSMRFVNTSYYMPERPDLQPVIAHEVAHALIRDHFDHLDGVSLGAADDNFSDLLASIQRALTNFNSWGKLPKQYTDSSIIELSREIACDLLAASVKGYSYLYALFLDMAGVGTELLLSGRSNDHRIKLTNIYEVSSGPPIAALSREWFLRIKVTIHWLRMCHHLDEGELGSHLMSGIEHALDELNEYLDSLIDNADRQRGVRWRHVTELLCEKLDSKTIKSIRDWRIKRSSDDIKAPKVKQEYKKEKGKRELPRSMARIHRDVRNSMFYSLLSTKYQNNRPLGRENHPKDLQNKLSEFRKYYGIVPLDERYAFYNRDDEANTIFSHLYDISWQSSLLRAMDMLGGLNEELNAELNVRNSKNQLDKIIIELHRDFPIGRDFFSFALEFYLWSSEPAIYRLSNVLDIVKNLIGELEDKAGLKALQAVLKKWVAGNISIDEIPDEALNTTREKLKEDVKKYSAHSILKRYQESDPLLSTKLHRSIERAAGFKLEELFNYLKSPDFNFTLDKEQNKIVQALNNFLPNRSNRQESKQKFIDNIIKAITNYSLQSKNDCDLQIVTLGRIASYSIYPNLDNKETHEAIRDNLLSDIMPSHYDYEESAYIWSVLGRYDAITIGKTRPICRCPLPYFFIKKNGRNTFNTPDEFFPPFFLRQEMALMGVFGQEKLDIDKFLGGKNKKPIAFSAISLQKRQYRLDFLYRLIEPVNFKCVSHSKSLSALTRSIIIKGTDAYFLTDGWGDLVLMFSACDRASTIERLRKIFEFQTYVFQDFMVDRTDLILTPETFNLALRDNIHRTAQRPQPQPKEWSLALQIRCVEDRFSNSVNDKFMAYFKQGTKNDGNKKILDFIDLELSMALGRADYIIEIIPKQNVNISNLPEEINFFQEILKFVHPEYLDRVDTLIAHNKSSTSENSAR